MGEGLRINFWIKKRSLLAKSIEVLFSGPCRDFFIPQGGFPFWKRPTVATDQEIKFHGKYLGFMQDFTEIPVLQMHQNGPYFPKVGGEIIDSQFGCSELKREGLPSDIVFDLEIPVDVEMLNINIFGSTSILTSSEHRVQLFREYRQDFPLEDPVHAKEFIEPIMWIRLSAHKHLGDCIEVSFFSESLVWLEGGGSKIASQAVRNTERLVDYLSAFEFQMHDHVTSITREATEGSIWGREISRIHNSLSRLPGLQIL